MRASLERLVAERGVGGRVVLPRFRADLDSLIGAADVVVLPSFTEGLPHIALEASAGGVPVVATAVGGTPEVVADGETGILVAPRDHEAMAEAIVRLLKDDDLRRRMGDAGRARARSLFSAERMVQNTVGVYHRVAMQPRREE
jgi:glycosyltransferase involved in cell wall biosynthesis